MQAEQNELITRIGPGTRLRRADAQLLAAGGAARRVRSAARPAHGARGRSRRCACSARTWCCFATAPAAGACSTAPARIAAPTSPFGRLEPDGLRCPFHGWKFDADGRCLETPAEPVGSHAVHSACASAAIRCASVAACCSPGSAPRARRRRRCRRSTASSRRRATASPSRASGTATGCRRSRSASIRRIRRSCTATCRTSRSLDDAYGRQFRAASAGEVGGERWPMTRVMREFCQPEIRFESVADGLLRLTTLRPMTDDAHPRARHPCRRSRRPS